MGHPSARSIATAIMLLLAIFVGTSFSLVRDDAMAASPAFQELSLSGPCKTGHRGATDTGTRSDRVDHCSLHNYLASSASTEGTRCCEAIRFDRATLSFDAAAPEVRARPPKTFA